jgi:hypothetical protein
MKINKNDKRDAIRLGIDTSHYGQPLKKEPHPESRNARRKIERAAKKNKRIF